MRAFLFLLLFLLLAVAQSAPKPLPEPKEVAPPAVLKLAEAYVNGLPHQKSPTPERAEAQHDFTRTFLTGFTQPRVEIGNPNDAEAKGLAAGRTYRTAHPDKIKEILEGYGYVATETEGRWKFGFEQSGFRSKKSPTEEWWLTVLGDLPTDLQESAEKEKGVPVQATGYLSPLGMYGHFGVGSRQFFVTKIARVK